MLSSMCWRTLVRCGLLCHRYVCAAIGVNPAAHGEMLVVWTGDGQGATFQCEVLTVQPGQECEMGHASGRVVSCYD